MMSLQSGPLVSVVIATYNRPAYLQAALASVIRGKYRNVEIIVADDGGNDANGKVVAAFADPRVVYRRNENNLGMAANHIHAFRKLASGELLTILNDDDEWGPDFPGKLVPLLNDPEIVMAFSDHYIMDALGRIDIAATEANTRRWRRDTLPPGMHRPFWDYLVRLSIPIAQACVIRRSAIDWSDYPPETGSAYDQWLGYLACRTGKACYYLPERLTRYRAHGDSSTASASDQGSVGMIQIYERLMAMPDLSALHDEIEARCAGAHLTRALFLVRAGRPREARAHLRKAVALGGLTAKTALAIALANMPAAFAPAMLGAARWTRWR